MRGYRASIFAECRQFLTPAILLMLGVGVDSKRPTFTLRASGGTEESDPRNEKTRAARVESPP